MSAAPATSTAPGVVLLGAPGGQDRGASGAARDRAAAFDAALTTADRMLGADAVGARDARGADEDGTTDASCGHASEAVVSTPAGAVPALTDARPGEERVEPLAISSPAAALASIPAVPAEASTVVVTDAVSTTASGGTSTGESAAAVGAASATAAGRTTAGGTPQSDAETPVLLLAAREDAVTESAAAAPRTGTDATHEPPSVVGGSAVLPASGTPTAVPVLSASGSAPMSAVSRQDLRNVSLPTAPGAVGGAGDGAAAVRPSAPSGNVEVPAEVAPEFSPRSEFPARAGAEPGVAAVPATPTASAASAAPVPLPGVPPTASVAAAAAPAATANAPQPLAAQVAPAVLHLAQRPAGSHQLTMTIEPESLGPVTVRARISADGEVQVHLLGATDAGREALRTLLGDLRRDLAAISPHASVALGAGADAGGGAERGPSGNTEQTPRDHDQERGATHADARAESGASTPARLASTPSRPTAGAGLDIFA